MSGRHEPPTKRSFYFSLATSTLRFAIIVALVAGGIVLISKAFPEGASAPGPSVAPTVTPTPTQTPTQTPTETPSPQVAGVVLGVYNGTEVTGLAADTARKLEKRFGYVIPPENLGDTPTKPVDVTILYYASPSDKIEAQYLASGFFKDITPEIKKLPSGTDIPEGVQVAIYLGNDYAATVNAP
jgi:hypothetical protein